MAQSYYEFIPVNADFNGNVAAASGAVVRFTYTVPTNKRAVLHFISGRLSENVANPLGNGIFFSLTSGVYGTIPLFAQLFTQNAIAERMLLWSGDIDLFEGDVIKGMTNNASGVILFMELSMQLREFQ